MKRIGLTLRVILVMCIFFVSCKEEPKKANTKTEEILNRNEAKDSFANEEEINEEAKKVVDETKKAGEEALKKARATVDEVKKISKRFQKNNFILKRIFKPYNKISTWRHNARRI